MTGARSQPERRLKGRGLTVHVGDATLLAQVDVEIAPGTVTAVVGPNGAGKSTLLRVLAGEIQPTLGRVELDGRGLPHWPLCDLARRRAVLPQKSSVAFALSVLEVVLLGRLPHARGRRELPQDREVAMAALDHVGLAGLCERAYPSLSGGEQQRVQLARMLAQLWDPGSSGGRYLLLDEPLSAQDVGQQQRILDLVRRLADSGVGLLVVVHDLNAAASFADRVLLLCGGRAMAHGSPTRVLTPATVEEAFGVAVRVVPDPESGRPVILARRLQSNPVSDLQPSLRP